MLNKVTINNKHRIIRIGDLFNQIKGETHFSKTDLQSCYQQFRVNEYDIFKMDFLIRYGHYEFVNITWVD